jgi:hypothetical protein
MEEVINMKRYKITFAVTIVRLLLAVDCSACDSICINGSGFTIPEKILSSKREVTNTITKDYGIPGTTLEGRLNEIIVVCNKCHSECASFLVNPEIDRAIKSKIGSVAAYSERIKKFAECVLNMLGFRSDMQKSDAIEAMIYINKYYQNELNGLITFAKTRIELPELPL